MKVVFFFEYVINTKLSLIKCFFIWLDFYFFRVIIDFLNVEMSLFRFVGYFEGFFSNEN